MTFDDELSEHSPRLPGERQNDRLKRNRESAKRCRVRRKEYIQGIESKCKILEEQNQTLGCENSRLQLLVQQLLAKTSQDSQDQFINTDQDLSAKRIKLENGDAAADLTNESAVTQNSQQQEQVFYPLARATTILYLIASTHLVSTILMTALTHATRCLTPSANRQQAKCSQMSSGYETSKPLTLCSSRSTYHEPVRWPPDIEATAG